MQDTVMLGADYYETEAEVVSLVAEGRVPIGVGENTKIKYDKLYICPFFFFSLFWQVKCADYFPSLTRSSWLFLLCFAETASLTKMPELGKMLLLRTRRYLFFISI